MEEDEKDGAVLIVSGADLLDGTPIYDIKPYLPFTDCHPDAVGGYADQQKDYHLNLIFPERLKSLLPKDKLDGLIECLKDDPRPSYQNDDREYGMNFAGFEVKFKVTNDTLTVTDIIK